MKTVYLKWSNHEYGILGECGRMHSWCDTEEQADCEYFKVTNVFSNAEIVKLEIDEQSEKYPCVSMKYTPV